jgi:hypothetical protein
MQGVNRRLEAQWTGREWQNQPFNLETAVGREKDVQDIDVHRELKKRVVTFLVMSVFFIS